MEMEIIGGVIALLLGVVGYLLNYLISEFKNQMTGLASSINKLSEQVNGLNTNYATQKEEIINLQEQDEVQTERLNAYGSRIKAVEQDVLIIKTEHNKNHK